MTNTDIYNSIYDNLWSFCTNERFNLYWTAYGISMAISGKIAPRFNEEFFKNMMKQFNENYAIENFIEYKIETFIDEEAIANSLTDYYEIVILEHISRLTNELLGTKL